MSRALAKLGGMVVPKKLVGCETLDELVDERRDFVILNGFQYQGNWRYKSDLVSKLYSGKLNNNAVYVNG